MRANQMDAIAKTTPLMMVANVTCATLAFVAFKEVPSGWFLPYWTIALYLLASLSVYSSHTTEKRGLVYSASKRAYGRATKAAGTIAILWGILPVLLYPTLNPSYQAVVIALLCGMMGGGAMSLYFVPRALFTWVTVLAIGCGAALFLEGSYASVIVLVMLAVYSASLMRAGLTMANTFAKNTVTSFELIDQSETIGLLLRDFAESASDWLWEMNATGNLTNANSG